MKKLTILLLTLSAFSLSKAQSDSLTDDSTEKKVYISFFTGNTGLTNFTFDKYYIYETFDHYSESVNIFRMNAGLEFSFKLRKKIFFNMNWSLSLINYSDIRDSRGSSYTFSSSDYTITTSKSKLLCYSLKPGFSGILIQNEKYLVTTGLNMPFIAMGKYNWKSNYTIVAADTLQYNTDTDISTDASYILGLEGAVNLKYFACKKFFFTGTVSWAALYSWSNSDLIVKDSDLITGNQTSIRINKRTLSSFGFSDVCANLGFGFRF